MRSKSTVRSAGISGLQAGEEVKQRRQPTRFVTQSLLVISVAMAANCAAAELDLAGDEMPIALSPTRLRQPLADVPGSVTIITADMLRNFGIRSVPDALRLVPGMAVTQVAGSDYRINYHGTSIFVPRRMNVLLDGVSLYRPAFARVDWNEIPIAIEDIDRIEVTRGPNSATYGANSMLATIHIISKHPGEVHGTTMRATLGSLATDSEMLRYGGTINESTAYRLTYEHSKDHGYDKLSNGIGAHDSSRFDKISLRSVTDIQPTQTLDLQLNVVQGMKQSQYIDRYQVGFPDISTSDYSLSALWRNALSSTHDVQVRAYTSHHRYDQDWRTCPPTAVFLPEMFALWKANKQYVSTILSGKIPSGGSAEDDALAAAALRAIAQLGPRAVQPTCADGNQDFTEGRTDVEFQDTYIFSDELRMVSGLGIRHERGDSATYLGGSASNDTWRAFGNVEYKPTTLITVNLGGFLEHDSLTDTSFSPRLGVNYHVTKNNTLRFVASRATRMPDIEEQKAEWTYRGTNFNPPLNGAREGYFFQSATASGDLSGERNTTLEIGLLSNYPHVGLIVDGRLFKERLTRLISEKLQLSDFNPTNDNSARLRGAELQVSYLPSEKWAVHAAYSYLENNPTTELERSQYARHSGSFGITRLFDYGWRGSIVYYGYGAQGQGQSTYDREDLTISKSWRFANRSRLMSALTLSYLNNRRVSYLTGSNPYTESYYKDNLHAYFTVQLAYE